MRKPVLYQDVDGHRVDVNGSWGLTGARDKDAPQPTYGGNTDAFVTRLTRSGSSAVYSTYLGGNRREDGMAIAIDLRRSTYVTGFTASRNLPTTPGAFQTSFSGDRDSFVAKLANSRSGAPARAPKE